MPQKNGYEWEDPNNPPEIEEHSKVKHDVIRFYLERYISVLTSDPRHDGLRLNIIDGFAGGGRYRDEVTHSFVDGSPLLLIKTVRNMARLIQSQRKKPFILTDRYYFIEKNKIAYDCLNIVLKEEGIRIERQNFNLFNSEFAKTIPDILNQIKRVSDRARSLFLLDQYGYKDVPLATLNLIFSFFPDTAEVILTFSTDTIVNYLANNEKFMKTMRKVGFEDIFTEDKITGYQESPQKRLIIEQELYKEICLKSGARFFTPFFIKSRKSSRSYWLVHLSNHPRARNEMCDIHWKHNNNFVHHGGAGLNGIGSLEMVLGYEPKYADANLQNSFEFVFDDDAGSRTIDSLMDDIPRLLSYDNTLLFSDLFAETCNGTPANMEHYQKAIFQLQSQKDIQLLSHKDGKLKKPRGHTGINGDSIIILNKQIGLF